MNLNPNDELVRIDRAISPPSINIELEEVIKPKKEIDQGNLELNLMSEISDYNDISELTLLKSLEDREKDEE